MVVSVIQTFRTALKYRGGWRGLLEHMYTNGDYPFKVGTYMGCDAAGNRYYENRADYAFGQHRWVEPADIHNFDSASIPPEWHGWMTHQNDVTPFMEQEYMEKMHKRQIKSEHSDAPYIDNVGHQEPVFNFHHIHNQSTVKPRGYQIGNQVVGLPGNIPKDKQTYGDGGSAFYTQPGSLYNVASIRPREYIGDLDEKTGGGRPYKSDLWKERLTTPEEKAAAKKAEEERLAAASLKEKETPKLTVREQAILARGGTISK